MEDVDLFCSEMVAPAAEDIELTARFFPELLSEAAQLGLQSLLFEADGSLDLARMALVHESTERIAAESAAVSLAVSVARLHTYLLARYAASEVCDRWLQPTLRAELFGAFAITEPHAGTDIRALTTVARRQGDHYVLDGQKCWIGLAPVCSYAIVLAKVDHRERDADTIALVVDMASDGAVGAPGPELAGFRGMPNGTLTFEACRVPVQNALACDGFGGMMDGLNMARIEAASYSVGLLRGAIREATGWANHREAFGKPIAALPSIQSKIGRMVTDYRAARELVLRAGETFALGNGGDQAVISMAKMFASDAARRHTDAALQIVAGAGMARNHPLQRMDRDAKVTQIFDGTSEIHETMLGRRVLREAANGLIGPSFFPDSNTAHEKTDNVR
ncbi:acyl-CoA dehydrogenase family protein [Nocardioides gansuensis]|uniref:acyl-CoA dehydrogenase family protein n=1 Tax=Nocardioides gansuensis TaxID=2138300 RepID=UPI001BADC12C|nr:acyl-CoA dehydrogenase family protein [Nocardioides gansuensis]